MIDDFGEQHLRTGDLIVYTSADSVLQIAAHTAQVPESELYAACAAAREIMRGEHAVGRVIARPFRGEPGAFERTDGRRDLAVDPPSRSYLEELRARRHPRPHRRQGRRRCSTTSGSTSSTAARQRQRARGHERADRRAAGRPRVREPRRDRPGLRPPQGHPRLPRGAEGDRRRGGGVAAAAGPGPRPAGHHRRPRRRPDHPGDRPHARARPAAGALPPTTAGATTGRSRTSARACCAGSPGATRPASRAPRSPSVRLGSDARAARGRDDPPPPRARTSRAGRWTRWRSATSAGRGRSRRPSWRRRSTGAGSRRSAAAAST